MCSLTEAPWGLLLLMSVIPQKTESVNLALNKPAVRSEPPNPWGGGAPNANDGGYATNWAGDTCMMSAPSDQYQLPWWQVDLQAMYFIKTVKITNRDDVDVYAWRLHNITIELYCENPAENTALLPQVCTVLHTYVAPSATVTLTCEPWVRGQFLRVRKIKMRDGWDALQFCEIEVYGDLVPPQDKYMPINQFRNFPYTMKTGSPIKSLTVSKSQCAIVCLEVFCCTGFNFRGNISGMPGTCDVMSGWSGTIATSSVTGYYRKES